jgi:hypothetical protein
MNLWQWFQENTLTLMGAAIVISLLVRNKYPTAAGWQAFLDSFESKGGQLLLLWITDLIFVAVLIRYWKNFDATVQTTVVGILSAVNGAFLGAVGARATSPPGGSATPDTLKASFVPAGSPTEEKKQ